MTTPTVDAPTDIKGIKSFFSGLSILFWVMAAAAAAWQSPSLTIFMLFNAWGCGVIVQQIDNENKKKRKRT